MIKKSNLVSPLVFSLVVFMIMSFYIFELKSWGRYVIFLISSAVLLIDATSNQMKITLYFEKFHNFVMAFIFICLCSAMWAWNPSLAISKTITIFSILFCMSMIYPHYRKKNNVDDLLRTFLVSGYLLCVYTIFYYGVSDITSFLVNNTRIGNDFTNANALGLVSAMSIIIQVYYILGKKIDKWCVFLIPALIVLAISQSRKAIIMVVLGVFFLIITSSSNKRLSKKILSIICGIIILFLFLYVLSNFPIFSGVMKRFTTLFESMNGTRSEDIRAIFRRIGMEQFRKTPIFGIGIGNSLELLSSVGYNRTYLHSNIVELLASLGIIGFSIYYSIYAYLGYKLFKYRKYESATTNLCLVLLAMMLIMDYGMVSYYDKQQYLYLMCFFLHVRNIENNNVNNLSTMRK